MVAVLGMKALDDEIRRAAALRAAAVEARLREAIKDGEREVILVDSRNGSVVVYSIPTWRRHPIARLRIMLGLWGIWR